MALTARTDKWLDLRDFVSCPHAAASVGWQLMDPLQPELDLIYSPTQYILIYIITLFHFNAILHEGRTKQVLPTALSIKFFINSSGEVRWHFELRPRFLGLLLRTNTLLKSFNFPKKKPSSSTTFCLAR